MVNAAVEFYQQVRNIEAAFYLVTDADELAAGDRLVIVSTSKGTVAGQLKSTYLTSLSVDIEDDRIDNLPDDAIVFVLGGSNGRWTLADAEGRQLGATKVKTLAWGSGTTTWTIEISGNAATIYNTTSSYGRILYNASAPRFTTYTSGTSATMLLPEIYKQSTTSSIEEVEEVHNGVVYDLAGRRVDVITAPGIYIVNGKKVVVTL